MTPASVGHVDRVVAAATSGAAISALAASWRRSLICHGLDPSRRRERPLLSKSRLEYRLQQSEQLLYCAEKRLDQLYGMLGRSGCGVFLTDSDGIVLRTRCCSSDEVLFRENDLWQGADWSEAAEGTNGIGTCLADKRHVVIDRDDHFLACHTSLTCIDAPIFCSNGHLVGAIDVSSARLDHEAELNNLILAAVLQTARQIETDLFYSRYSGTRIVLAGGECGDQAVLLAVDDDDLVVGASRTARRQFKLPASGAFDPMPYVDLVSGQIEKRRSCGFARGERAAIARALSRTHGNVSKAAEMLGIGRATLYRRMKRLEFVCSAELSHP
ncbi:MAG: helix-turn-helix domain-containing protein [Pseudomonadota bacterium]